MASTMRRRLTTRFVAVVALALVLGGLGSVLLAARSERRATREELGREASAVADGLDEVRAAAVLRRASELLRLQGAEVVRVDAAGHLTGTLPAPLRAADVDDGALRAGRTTSGVRRGTAWAMAAATPPTSARAARGGGPIAVVVLTRRASPGIGRTVGYLTLAGGLALLVAALVGDALGRRLARPLVAVAGATRRIAGGDLTARVEVRPDEVPELVELAGGVNALAVSLAASREHERRLLLSVSHDLRTPLTSIRGFAEAIADGTATDAPGAARIVAREADRLERLVADLLQLAKLEAGSLPVDRRPFDLAEVVADTAVAFGPTADRVRVALDLGPLADGAAPLPAISAHGDPDRTAQVVANLVENALAHAATVVRVRAEARGGWATFSVDDDGPGIPADQRARVFERLYQVPGRTTSRHVGSGLGLAIVAALVGAMGGQVRADEAPGGGARMLVALPAGASAP